MEAYRALNLDAKDHDDMYSEDLWANLSAAHQRMIIWLIWKHTQKCDQFLPGTTTWLDDNTTDAPAIDLSAGGTTDIVAAFVSSAQLHDPHIHDPHQLIGRQKIIFLCDAKHIVQDTKAWPQLHGAQELLRNFGRTRCI